VNTPDPSSDLVAPDGVAHVSLTSADVTHLAHLARLELTDAEVEVYVGQLSGILDSVAEVSRVATPDIVPTTHAVPLSNVYRDDVIVPGLTHDEALDQAPAQAEGRFRVPQILGEEQ
jgi:aspartyl-tRNA(Asn)/glutamyl-tRNA(Gln) amidotransferase subunit C